MRKSENEKIQFFELITTYGSKHEMIFLHLIIKKTLIQVFFFIFFCYIKHKNYIKHKIMYLFTYLLHPFTRKHCQSSRCPYAT